MSSPRVQKLFEAMPNQLKRLGGYDIDFRQVLRWQGRVTAGTFEGRDAALVDLDSSSWSTGNKRAILIAEPAADFNNTQAMLTQSHAQGFFLDGSVRFDVYMESPATFTNDLANFMRNLQQHLVGQLGSPTKFHFTSNTTEPTVEGVNGAGSTATFADGEWLLPYGQNYVGGV